VWQPCLNPEIAKLVRSEGNGCSGGTSSYTGGSARCVGKVILDQAGKRSWSREAQVIYDGGRGGDKKDTWYKKQGTRTFGIHVTRHPETNRDRRRRTTPLVGSARECPREDKTKQTCQDQGAAPGSLMGLTESRGGGAPAGSQKTGAYSVYAGEVPVTSCNGMLRGKQR